MSNGQDSEIERQGYIKELTGQIRGFSWADRSPLKGAMSKTEAKLINEILIKHLPNGRVAVYSTYECGSYRPPIIGQFRYGCDWYDAVESFLYGVESELALPPMGIERIVGRMAILFPLPPEPPDTPLSLPDDIPF